MTGAIVKKFEETVYNALNKYAEKYKVSLEETGLCLSVDEDNEVKYEVLLAKKDEAGKITGFNAVEQVGYVSGIMFKKIDLSGQSMIVPAFIHQTMKMLSGVNECQVQEIFVNIFPVKGKAQMYLYVKKRFTEVLDLKKLLE
jgi:hypothetical protein